MLQCKTQKPHKIILEENTSTKKNKNNVS